MSHSNDFNPILDFIMERTNEVSPYIKGTPKLTPTESLLIYRNDYQNRLVSILKDHYPITHRFLGEDLFTNLAESYLALQPPKTWNLSDFGDQFPEHLISSLNSLLTSDIPFIKDLACLERASLVFFNEEAPKPLIPLTDTPSEEWLNELILSPQLRFFSSPFEIPKLYRWAQNQVTTTSPLNYSHLCWQNPTSYFLSMNNDFITELNDFSPTEFQLITLWKKHQSLGSLIQALESPNFSPAAIEPYLKIIPSLLAKLSRLGFIIATNGV